MSESWQFGVMDWDDLRRIEKPPSVMSLDRGVSAGRKDCPRTESLPLPGKRRKQITVRLDVIKPESLPSFKMDIS
jgi:hypothetical protein